MVKIYSYRDSSSVISKYSQTIIIREMIIIVERYDLWYKIDSIQLKYIDNIISKNTKIISLKTN